MRMCTVGGGLDKHADETSQVIFMMGAIRMNRQMWWNHKMRMIKQMRRKQKRGTKNGEKGGR